MGSIRSFIHINSLISPLFALHRRPRQRFSTACQGASRFAREGHNLFGLWCFTAGCGMVPKSRPDGAVHEVTRFASVQWSVREYMRTLNSHPSYQLLRKLRSRQPPQAGGAALAQGLEEYSARGEQYIDKLKNMIEYNHWADHDQMVPTVP